MVEQCLAFERLSLEKNSYSYSFFVTVFVILSQRITWPRFKSMSPLPKVGLFCKFNDTFAVNVPFAFLTKGMKKKRIKLYLLIS